MRILVVEDDVVIAQAIKKGLEQEKGFAVDIVHDGEKGYDLASSESFDCIILDRMIPKIDGLSLCHMLRNEQNTVPILMLTAKGQTYEKVEGLNAGADDYLPKPFSFDELVARVRALTRRPKTMIPDRIVIADFVMDTVSYAVSRAGQSIPLTQKEYAVLKYLAIHSPSIVTKDQLIEHVWSFDADILPNTVEAVIKNLRKKIDDPFPEPIIHTVRGFGYKICSKMRG